jgi:hypothetical protein
MVWGVDVDWGDEKRGDQRREEACKRREEA